MNKELKTCNWVLEEEDIWSVECCDKLWHFSIRDSTPTENEMVYCPFCGKKIVEYKEG